MSHEKSQKEQVETILAYLEVGNIEGIREMFCERLRNKKDVDDELQKVIDIFQGEIISYTAKGAEGGASWSPEGNQVSAWASCSDILMSTGKIYHLYLSIYKENDFHPDMLGIYSLEVSEKDEISGVWIELIRIEV